MEIQPKMRILLATLFGAAAVASAWQSPTALTDSPPPSDVKPAESPEHLGGWVEPLDIPGLQRSPTEQRIAWQLAKFGLEDPFTHDANAQFHAHGDKVCASGCAASRHPTEELTLDEFKRLMREVGEAPLDRTNLAFETLLYYGRQTSDWILKHGTFGLPTETIETLNHELQRSHVNVEIRVIDEHGEVRSWLDATRVPLDRRHVFEMETERLQPLVTSGTVKRVGLDHLWTRL